MTYLGYIMLIVPILIESLIKIIWGIVYYAFLPLWKKCFPNSIEKMEDYTRFKYEYKIVTKILDLWD